MDRIIQVEIRFKTNLPPDIHGLSKLQVRLSSTEDIDFEFKPRKSAIKDYIGQVGMKIVLAKELLEEIKSGMMKLNLSFENGKLSMKVSGLKEVIKRTDAYLFELRGVLDVFVIIIDLSYGPWKYEKSNLLLVKDKLKKHYPNDPMTRLVERLFDESWFVYFNKLRNRATHRMPVSFGLGLDNSDPLLLFPDDPDKLDSAVKKEFEVIECCKEWLDKTAEFLEKGSYLIESRLYSSQ